MNVILNYLRDWLYEPAVRELNVDDNALLEIHSTILLEKHLLRSAYQTFYQDMTSLCESYLSSPGIEIELGTGAGFFKSLRSALFTSDVRTGAGIDINLDAQQLALKDDSVRCVYAINVFHHLPQPERFLAELVRVLRAGGGCILIEPHGGLFSSVVHRHLHKDEHFDPLANGWGTSKIGGPLSGANQALADIVFKRDLLRFEEMYGDKLEIVYLGFELNALRYLFSGGLNFRQVMPNSMERPLAWIEQVSKSFAQYWSLHQVIVIRRRQ